MGLLRDTYNITEVDMSGVEAEMRRKNDIQEQYNEEKLRTKDRVNVALKDYEKLKEELEERTKELVKRYVFIKRLADSIGENPEVLLKGRVVKGGCEIDPLTKKRRIYAMWEFDLKDFIDNN